MLRRVSAGPGPEVRAFNTELDDKSHFDGAGAEMLQVASQTPARTHEAHRRCDTPNSVTLRQTEANDVLLQTLNTLKELNRRMLEQIGQQTEKVQTLTQQRILDEGRHQAEVEKLRQAPARQDVLLDDALGCAVRFPPLRPEAA